MSAISFKFQCVNYIDYPYTINDESASHSPPDYKTLCGESPPVRWFGRTATQKWSYGSSSIARIKMSPVFLVTLQWRHNGRDGVSNHPRLDCLLNRLFSRRSKKTSKLRVIGPCDGNSPVTDEFPAQRSSYAENVSIWWRHHESLDWSVKSDDLFHLRCHSIVTLFRQRAHSSMKTSVNNNHPRLPI